LIGARGETGGPARGDRSIAGLDRSETPIVSASPTHLLIFAPGSTEKKRI
jgi:hypothetical protein